ncbi:MAG TPA: GYD domain-containing protein [Pyrinomonadaceae bacterium]|nr:GYD domain-containing protein [Pyrinomonadaceae bacterium]
MPKYLIQGSYSEQGLKGVLKEGGSSRREAAEQSIKGMGGRLEAYYYAFGSDDFVSIVGSAEQRGCSSPLVDHQRQWSREAANNSTDHARGG